ncbi:hypothetical protein BJX61DRAFT_506982 [Aspergillus egyptiacus]|nr:hypothetical protein BJX61DRAFT_506982 [Aspergillus egyptiacus]
MDKRNDLPSPKSKIHRTQERLASYSNQPRSAASKEITKRTSHEKSPERSEMTGPGDHSHRLSPLTKLRGC